MALSHHRPDDPLDARFDELDRRTDRQISDLVDGLPVPAGLEDRLYAASVHRLPPPAVLTMPTVRRSAMSTWLSRSAVAAALAVVATAAWWSSRPSPTPAPERTAMGPSFAATPGGEVADLEWHAGDELAAMHGQVAWILASEDVRRTTDVVGELTRLFPEVGE